MNFRSILSFGAGAIYCLAVSSSGFATVTFTGLDLGSGDLLVSSDGSSWAYSSSFRWNGDYSRWHTPNGDKWANGYYVQLLSGNGEGAVVFIAGPSPVIHWSATGDPVTWNHVPDTKWSMPVAISYDGSTVVGYAFTSGVDYRAFRGSVTEPVEDLGTLGGGSAWAHLVNRDGSVVVGHAETAEDTSHAFRWTRSTGMVDLGTLGGHSSGAVALSDDGEVIVGNSADASGHTRAFRWTPSHGMQDLGTLGGSEALAWRMNAAGTVVVGTSAETDGTLRLFRWEKEAGMTRIDIPDIAEVHAARPADDGATIVGPYIDATGERRAYRWFLAHGWQDLGPLGPGGDVMLSPDGQVITGHFRPAGNFSSETSTWFWSEATGWRGLGPLLDALGANTSNFSGLNRVVTTRGVRGEAIIFGLGPVNDALPNSTIWYAKFAIPNQPVNTAPIAITSIPQLKTGNRLVMTGEVYSDGGTPVEAVGFVVDGRDFEATPTSIAGEFGFTLRPPYSYPIVEAFAENSVGRSKGLRRDMYLPPIPEVLTWTDIGAPVLAGSQSYSQSGYQIIAGGSDMWGDRDQFRLGHETLVGDGRLLVRVNELSAAHPWARCGLTFRSSLAPDAAHVSVFLSQGNGIDLQVRHSNGAQTERVIEANAAVVAPIYLELVREGDIFTASYSLNGKTWTTLGSASVALPPEAQIGLFACAVSETTPVTAGVSYYACHAASAPDDILGVSGDFDFGDVQLGAHVDRSFNVTNQTTGTWSTRTVLAAFGTSVEFPGDIQIAPGESVSGTVRFGPSSAGTHVGFITWFVGDHYFAPAIGKVQVRGRGILSSPPLQWANVGSSTTLGHQSYHSAEQGYRIVATGADMWGDADQFRFGYADSSRDDALAMRVDSLSSPHPWSRVGLTFRSGLQAYAPHVSLIVTEANGIDLQWRATAGGETSRLAAPIALSEGGPPVHLRLVRMGDSFIGLWSTDGSAWQVAGSVEVVMPAAVLGGIAACSVSADEPIVATVSGFARGSDVPTTPASLFIDTSTEVYDGNPKLVTATTVPAGLPVIITYAGSTSAPVEAGTYPIAAEIDSQYFSGSASATFKIAPTSQELTLAPIADTVFGATPFALIGQSSAGLPVSFSIVSGPAGIAGDTLTITGAGLVTVHAAQPGGANHLPAVPVERSFTVAPAPAIVTLSELVRVYTGAPHPVAVATQPADLTAAVRYDGSPQPPAASGTYAVVATIDEANYTGEATATLTIAKASQSLTFTPIADQTYGGPPVPLVASATSGLPVMLSIVSGPASVAGGHVVITGTGLVTVRATQSGDANHQPATHVERSFVVTQAAATISLADLAHVFDGRPAPVTATTNPPGLAVHITYDGSETAPSLIGEYTVVATITDGDFAGSTTGALVIAAPDPTGTYHGGFDATPSAFRVRSAAASAAGGWAIRVAPDGRATMLALLPSAPTTFLAEFQIELDGSFVGLDDRTGLAVEGSVLSGQATGAFPALGLGFSGSVSPAAPGAADAGMFATARILHSPDGVLCAILAPDGHALVLLLGTGLADGGTGTLQTDGTIQVDLSSGAVFLGSHQASTGAFAGTITPSTGGPALAVMGHTGATPSSTRLVNLSTRGDVRSIDEVMIAGFVISGEGSHRVLVRAIGPGLEGILAGHAADTSIRLVHQSDGSLVAANDDWIDDVDRLEEAITLTGAFPVPAGSKDAMLLLDLPAGSYTALVEAVPSEGHVAIAEVYSVPTDTPASARLVNISTRARVGTGEGILIPGFVTEGDLPRRVLIRAVGPGLIPALGSAALVDPVLRVYTGVQGNLVTENDDWSADGFATVVTEASEQAGAFLLAEGSKDAALVFTVSPQTGYTVQISGAGGTTGIVLAEVYELP